jgi:hypothetical protein
VLLEPPKTAADTVILRYFLFVQEAELLFDLVGKPVAVPRIVYDPDEGAETPEAARSEITRSIGYQRCSAADRTRDETARRQAEAHAERLQSIRDLHTAGALTTVDLLPDEWKLVSSLTSPSGCKAFNLKFPLGAGEAACLAVAVERNLVLATDDSDALKALASVPGTHPYQRIRKLLIAAATNKRISQERANAIHAEMRRLGFWDRTPPFP